MLKEIYKQAQIHLMGIMLDKHEKKGQDFFWAAKIHEPCFQQYLCLHVKKLIDTAHVYIIPVELGTSALKSTGLSLTAQNNDYRLSPGLVCFPHTEFLIKAIKV